MDTLSTGELAARADVNVQTVRYYERRGLLPEPPRLPSGYRRYDDTHVARLRFIRRGQALGFTLDEIDALLDLRADPSADRADVRARTEAKIRDVEAKIRDLERIRDTLRGLAHACEGRGDLDACPILHAFEEEYGND